MGMLTDAHAGGAPPGVPLGWQIIEDLLASMDDDDRSLLLSWLRAPIPASGQHSSGEVVGTFTIITRLRAAGYRISSPPLDRYRRWLQTQEVSSHG